MQERRDDVTVPAEPNAYDLILVGTSFASSFFLLEYARHAPGARILVLERGEC